MRRLCEVDLVAIGAMYAVLVAALVVWGFGGHC